MGNLSSAIIEARKRHEAEIAERLKRRQQRQRAEVERLNATAGDPAPAPEVTAEPVAEAPTIPVVDEQSAPEPISSAPESRIEPPAVEARVEPTVSRLTVVERREEPAPAPPRTQVLEPPLAPTPVAPTPTLVVADELETLPDGRFLRLRNDIIDRIKPYLTGNQFAVYMELYRQTVGRGKTSGWFRTRDIQNACNLGSDNTVRDAYPVLEQKRLVRLDPNRRAGSPKGLHVTVLSVERALERLERSPAAAAARPSPTEATVDLPAADLRVTTDASGAPATGGEDSTIQTLIRRYGVSPSVAPHLIELVKADDRPLLPYLFARLDRSVASGKVHNPAGLLRVWLESFDSWRGELEADRERDEEAKRRERSAASRDELMVEWFKWTEATAQERLAEMPADELARLRELGRTELLSRSPAVRTWSDAQWSAQLDTYVKSAIRRDLDSFDAWLAKTGRA